MKHITLRSLLNFIENYYGRFIRLIDNQDEETQLEAVREYGNSIKYIDSPTDKVKQYYESRIKKNSTI